MSSTKSALSRRGKRREGGERARRERREGRGKNREGEGGVREGEEGHECRPPRGAHATVWPALPALPRCWCLMVYTCIPLVFFSFHLHVLQLIILHLIRPVSVAFPYRPVSYIIYFFLIRPENVINLSSTMTVETRARSARHRRLHLPNRLLAAVLGHSPASSSTY